MKTSPRLHVPKPPKQHSGESTGVENEILVFDEHGSKPSKTAIEYAWKGEMD